MPDWYLKWLYKRIRYNARFGRFAPTISAWGNMGVWYRRVGLMEFQLGTEGDAVWLVYDEPVVKFANDLPLRR